MIPAISPENAQFSYGRRLLLRCLDLIVEKARSWPCWGRRGAEKGTVLRLILGLGMSAQGSPRLAGALAGEGSRLLFEERPCMAVHVTHDFPEAAWLGDRIAVMKSGRIVQAGTLHEVHEKPASPFANDLVDDLPWQEPPHV